VRCSASYSFYRVRDQKSGEDSAYCSGSHLPASCDRHQLHYRLAAVYRSRMIRSAPEPVTEPLSGTEAQSDPAKRGKYLTSLGCGCHTATDRRKPVRGLGYGGGDVLTEPWGGATSANITPDPSGRGYYDKVEFIQTMGTGYAKARKLSSIMPFGEVCEPKRRRSKGDLCLFAHPASREPAWTKASRPPTASYAAGSTEQGIRIRSVGRVTPGHTLSRGDARELDAPGCPPPNHRARI